MLVGVVDLDGGLPGLVPAPVPLGPFDAVLVVQPAVEPHGRIEGAPLGDQQVGQLVGEGLGVRGGTEIALLLAVGTDGADDAAHHLLHRGFPPRTGHARLAEVFGDDDVRRQLAPVRGHFRVVHFEDDPAPRLGDRRAALLEGYLVKGIPARLGKVARNGHAPPGGIFRPSLDGRRFHLFAHGDPLLWLEIPFSIILLTQQLAQRECDPTVPGNPESGRDTGATTPKKPDSGFLRTLGMVLKLKGKNGRGRLGLPSVGSQQPRARTGTDHPWRPLGDCAP